MKRLQEIDRERNAMGTMVELTSIFEGIASMRISQIKNQVLGAQQFFETLWHIYTQIRVDDKFRFGRSQQPVEVIDKELYILITAEGGFSGDIDQKLINLMLETYNKDKNDIIVVGHHGAVQLAHAGIRFSKYFKLPEKDQNINVTPIIQEVVKYKTTIAYYQTYVSLMVQDVKRIELSNAVQQGARTTIAKDEVISEETYIFEPSTYAVVDHLERSMLQITLSQVILESKLAQYASRFRAMSASHNKASDSYDDLKLLYNRTKRIAKDERLKEMVNGLKKAKVIA